MLGLGGLIIAKGWKGIWIFLTTGLIAFLYVVAEKYWGDWAAAIFVAICVSILWYIRKNRSRG